MDGPPPHPTRRQRVSTPQAFGYTCFGSKPVGPGVQSWLCYQIQLDLTTSHFLSCSLLLWRVWTIIVPHMIVVRIQHGSQVPDILPDLVNGNRCHTVVTLASSPTTTLLPHSPPAILTISVFHMLGIPSAQGLCQLKAFARHS